MENYFDLNFDTAAVNAISNLGLAHMGDCVFEILCRAYLCAQGEKTVDKLHRDTIHLVKATSQAKFAEKMLPHLTEEETAVFKRGRNAHGIAMKFPKESPFPNMPLDAPDRRFMAMPAYVGGRFNVA